ARCWPAPLPARGCNALFAGEGRFRIDAVDAGEPGGLQCRRSGSRYIGPVKPWQLARDAARHGLAERAAEIDRPESVRYHLCRDAAQPETLAQHGLGIVG